MDFSWSDEQIALRQKYQQFAAEHLCDDAIDRDQNSRFDKGIWKKCADFGILGLSTPESLGGNAVPILDAIMIMEGIGYGCSDNGIPFALNAQLWTIILPIVKFGSDQQHAEILPKLLSGEWIGAHALTEESTGSDVFNMEMTAIKEGDEYVLNGAKELVTFSTIADIALVFANANPSKGKWGVTGFLVPMKTPGISVSPNQPKMGLRTVPFGTITFEDVRVPQNTLLGKEGGGFAITNHSLEIERCSILASQIGAMERQLEVSIDRAKTRKQYGQAIGKFQSVSNRVADMKLRLETARLLLYKVAWMKNEGKPAMMEAALLKWYISECFVESGLDAIRIFGGRGYKVETEVERDLRDAIGGVLYAGTTDIQKNIVSRLLGL